MMECGAGLRAERVGDVLAFMQDKKRQGHTESTSHSGIMASTFGSEFSHICTTRNSSALHCSI